VTRLLDLIAGALGAVALLLACTTVVTRYFAPALVFDWSDEVVIMLLIWAMFLTGYRLTVQRGHVVVDLLTHGRSERWRRRLEMAASLGLGVFALGMTVSGVMVAADALAIGERTESTARIPTFLYYAALPVGMALVALGAGLVLANPPPGPADEADGVEPL
jgi:TRAP-type C4-dicarboxylate transport system permease small subunit